MNLIFAASSWMRDREAWRSEFSALAKRNSLFLWPDLDAETFAAIPAEALAQFGENRFLPGTAGLFSGIRDHKLALDETALVGGTRACRQAAREASIPCFFLADAATGPEERREENVFGSVDEIVDAVWKVNTVERRLFPVVTVGGLLFDEAGDVLRVRTRKWSGMWGIPGGKVDYGETLENAFRREIREETGLEIVEIRLALTQEAVEHPEFFRRRHFVLVNYFGRVAGRHPAVRLNHEGADYFWGPLEASLHDAERPLNGPTRVLVEAALKSKSKGDSLWAF